VLRQRVNTVIDPIERVHRLGIFVVPAIVAVVVITLVVRGLRRPRNTAVDPCGLL
jgi:hypothetical protein